MSRQLANPIANMVSLPFQFNWFGHIAPFDSTAFVLNVQPVIPITLNEDWNLILRFILPFAGVPALTTNGIPQFGTSDITASLFFSPAHSKLIWGVGPVFTFPTSTNPALTSGQWGIGPTGVVLKEVGPVDPGPAHEPGVVVRGDGELLHRVCQPDVRAAVGHTSDEARRVADVHERARRTTERQRLVRGRQCRSLSSSQRSRGWDCFRFKSRAVAGTWHRERLTAPGAGRCRLIFIFILPREQKKIVPAAYISRTSAERHG